MRRITLGSAYIPKDLTVDTIRPHLLAYLQIPIPDLMTSSTVIHIGLTISYHQIIPVLSVFR